MTVCLSVRQEAFDPKWALAKPEGRLAEMVGNAQGSPVL